MTRGPVSDGFDFVVVGAGVVGLAIAARLASPSCSVLILEREAGIARGVTSRNSEVIHAGIYYPAASLKATLCVEGRERLYAWCTARRVPHRRVGKLIVAADAGEVERLESLLTRGRENGVSDLTLIEADRIRALEPEVRAVAALESPATGIVDAHAFATSLLAEAEAQGAVFAPRRSLRALQRSAGEASWSLEVVGPEAPAGESIAAGVVIDAAGLEADRVAGLAGIDLDAWGLRQHPCKGDYFVPAPGTRVEASRLIYPVPQTAGLGIHLTVDLGGRVRFGPDATYLEARDDFDVDAGKGPRFAEAVGRYWPALAEATLLPDYAGIRPKLAGPGDAFRDFVVEEASAWGAPRFVACVGIESPGLTAALAIAERVASKLGR